VTDDVADQFAIDQFGLAAIAARVLRKPVPQQAASGPRVQGIAGSESANVPRSSKTARRVW
jgi:hypothetical protein